MVWCLRQRQPRQAGWESPTTLHAIHSDIWWRQARVIAAHLVAGLKIVPGNLPQRVLSHLALASSVPVGCSGPAVPRVPSRPRRPCPSTGDAIRATSLLLPRVCCDLFLTARASAANSSVRRSLRAMSSAECRLRPAWIPVAPIFALARAIRTLDLTASIQRNMPVMARVGGGVPIPVQRLTALEVAYRFEEGVADTGVDPGSGCIGGTGCGSAIPAPVG